MVEKIPPHDIEAEESLLGALLLDGRLIGNIFNTIHEVDFYSERNSLIFTAISELYKRRETVNQITVAQELNRLNLLEKCGGASYLAHLISVCPTILDIDSYANIVHRLSVSRNLIIISEKLADIGYSACPDSSQTINQSSELFESFKSKNTVLGSKVITPVVAANELFGMLESYGKVQVSLQWGYRDLDYVTTGIYPELIVIGARPSVGKSQFMLDVAENIDNQNKKVLFVTSEMNLKQVLERSLAKVTGMSIRELRLNGIPAEKEKLVMDYIGYMAEGNIYYRTGKIYASDIFRETQTLKQTTGVDIVFVDYLQFLADCWEESRENQNIRVGKACKVLKNIVEELGVPVVVASQLSRAMEYRNKESKFPMLADLRDSGNIEQDADVVLLLHRDEDEDDPTKLSNVLQIKMAKNRQLGIASHINLVFNTKVNRYMDLADREYQN